MDHYKHYIPRGAADQQKPLLHVEFLPNEPGMAPGDGNMNFKLQGDPVIVSQMIAAAMAHSQDIAAAMIAAVCHFADLNGIPRDQIGNMVKFHGQ